MTARATRAAARAGGCGALLCSLLATQPGAAAVRRVDLRPPETSVGFRGYGLGFVPRDGSFARFEGAIGFDPDNPGRCTVDLSIATGSLEMGEQSIRDEVISASFLDAAAYPTIRFQGGCAPGSLIQGQLTLHGQTHPLTFVLEGDGHRVVGTATARRADWGVTARPFLVGSTIRITVSIPVPGDVAGMLAPGRR